MKINFFKKDFIMNWEQIEGQWKDLKGQVRSTWGKLTDDDLENIAGKKDQLLGKIQERYGFTKDKAEKALDDFTKKLDVKH
jgi:uncharacterized protein YjbJ (UPF0337 family)